MSRGSAVGIATVYGFDDGGVGVRVPLASRNFTSPYRPRGSGDKPTSYPMETEGFFAAGARS
jgi:hypothetical protein